MLKKMLLYVKVSLSHMASVFRCTDENRWKYECHTLGWYTSAPATIFNVAGYSFCINFRIKLYKCRKYVIPITAAPKVKKFFFYCLNFCSSTWFISEWHSCYSFRLLAKWLLSNFVHIAEAGVKNQRVWHSYSRLYSLNPRKTDAMVL